MSKVGTDAKQQIYIVHLPLYKTVLGNFHGVYKTESTTFQPVPVRRSLSAFPDRCRLVCKLPEDRMSWEQDVGPWGKGINSSEWWALHPSLVSRPPCLFFGLL